MLQKMRNMIKNDKGFTLIELMVVVVILGILAAIAIPRFTDKTAQAERAREKADIKIIQNAIDMYYFDEKDYPTDLEGSVTPDDLEALVPNYLQSVPEGIATIDFGDNGVIEVINYVEN
ncbi:MAG: prepilin-type N-terminal cleavage/methylation domain-containing protein [Dehalobacterium sp.]